MIRLLPLLLAVAAAILWSRLAAARAARALDAQSAPLDEPGLRPVLARLAAALDLDAIAVRLHDSPAINGLASHDGRVFLTRGFLDRFRAGAVSAEELGSVVAHELGHVALGHSRRRMIDFTGQNAVRMGLGLVLGRLLGGVGPWLAQGLMALLAAGLSRRDEREADRYAAALLVKAGIGTGPQVSLLRKLGRWSDGGEVGPPAWLRTHPAIEDRIAAIEADTARWLDTRT